MNYPKIPDFKSISDRITEYSTLMHEYGAVGVSDILGEIEDMLNEKLNQLKTLDIDRVSAEKEPDDLDKIRALRPDGPRKMWDTFDEKVYREKLTGALLARMAGCTLGAIVEFWSIEKMEKWAKHCGDLFPPVDYWSKAMEPYELRYHMSPCKSYTNSGIDGVPVDDDIAYTLLGLLTVEKYGLDFSVADVAKAWLEYLPYACTAEAVALNNLKAGIDPLKAGETNNPACQWIGADIRSDPFAYIAGGCPEKAASMAYHDAYISHRRNGIYGEMFFSAAQAAAFAADDPVDALKIGLTEIPGECMLAKEVCWALDAGRDVKDFRQARQLVDERYKGMHRVHTINNAVLTIFGLMIGGNDVTKVLSETVAMGMDNDCTTATAGSIVGAIVGIKGVPEHWHKNFNNTVHSYLIGQKKFKIDDLIDRFTLQAKKLHDNHRS